MKYDMVFEGGGAKGMVFAGACEVLFGRGHMFDRLLGTSAGAITATLLAAGYSPQEMLAALVEKGPDGKSVFSGFMGLPKSFTDDELRASACLGFLNGVDLRSVSLPAHLLFPTLLPPLLRVMSQNENFRHVLGFVERGGWFGADRFITWISERLDSGSVSGIQRAFSHLTLSEFHRATNVALSLVASDTTDESMLVLNHKTAPNCPVVWAVRMSMSIPLLWEEVIWQPGWGNYIDRDVSGHAIVDGGLLSNFPVELFISDSPHVTKLMGPKQDNPVLGLLIDEKLPVSGISDGPSVNVRIRPGELRTVQRIQQLVDTATGAHDKNVINEYGDAVVRLPAKGYGTTEFDMTDARRDALVAAGRVAMHLHLDKLAGMVSQTRSQPATVDENIANRVATGILQ